MPETSQRMKSPAIRLARRFSKLTSYLGALPALTVCGIFKLYPLVSGLQVSLQR